MVATLADHGKSDRAMIITCIFVDLGDCIACSRCGFTACNLRPPVRRVCGTQAVGLGDMVASGLSAIGITKAWVSALAGGDCGCAKRQEALNALGRRVGIG